MCVCLRVLKKRERTKNQKRVYLFLKQEQNTQKKPNIPNQPEKTHRGPEQTIREEEEEELREIRRVEKTNGDDFREAQERAEVVINSWTGNQLKAAMKRSRLTIQIIAAKKRKVCLEEIRDDVHEFEEDTWRADSENEEPEERNYDIDANTQAEESGPTPPTFTRTPNQNKSSANDSGISLISPVNNCDLKQTFKIKSEQTLESQD